MEHGENARRDAGKGQMYVPAAAVDFMIDDFAHAGRVNERNAAEIEDGVKGRFGTAKECTQRLNASESQGPDEAEDNGSWFGAGKRLDRQGSLGCHGATSVWNVADFVAIKLGEQGKWLLKKIARGTSQRCRRLGMMQ
jgi:hypothetical protein